MVCYLVSHASLNQGFSFFSQLYVCEKRKAAKQNNITYYCIPNLHFHYPK